MKKLSKPQLKIFISSAMGEENGTVWLSIRENIKDKLAECEYLAPFIIEDYATEIASTQFFTWQVTQADLIIILVKDELRPGTTQEIEKALEKAKPILVYFYNSDSKNQSAQQFKNFLISRDITTFKIVNDFSNIHEIVLNDVISNLITYYRFNHDTLNQQPIENFFPNEIMFEDSILDKKFLSYFGNNKNTLIDFLELSNYSQKIDEEIHEKTLSVQLLSWLCKGSNFITTEELNVMWEEFSLPENILKILKLRHQSIQKYFSNDLDGALTDLDEAFKIAQDIKAPNWLLGDILIDSRNIHCKLQLFEQKYQKTINELDSFINFPVGDRFLKEAFETLEKERLTVRTLSATTVRFGNTLLDSLQNVENYLYSSFIVGSSTHLLLSRKKMIELLIE